MPQACAAWATAPPASLALCVPSQVPSWPSPFEPAAVWLALPGGPCQPHHAPGSLPGLRRGTKAQPRARARGAPKIRPRASKPAECTQEEIDGVGSQPGALCKATSGAPMYTCGAAVEACKQLCKCAHAPRCAAGWPAPPHPPPHRSSGSCSARRTGQWCTGRPCG